MKHSFRRVRRRTSPKQDGNLFRKNNSEETFFGENGRLAFFQPASQNAVLRKCKDCDEEDKKNGAEQKKKPITNSKVKTEAPAKTKDDSKKQAANKKGAEQKKKPITDSKIKMEAPSKSKEDRKKEEDKKLMKKESSGSAAATSGTASVIPMGTAKPLPVSSQQFFGNKLGYDFSQVNIYDGNEAADKAKGLNAKAYTIGNNIVFNNGEYSTTTYDGKKLLAHELVHVMQQDGDDIKRINRKAENPSLEKENKITMPTRQGEVRTSNTTHYGCQGVHVEGLTTANYSNSFSFSSAGAPSTDCAGCADEECVSNTGTVVSVFNANPFVSLPTVPAGLNECEAAAVQNFIDNTLAPHEQQHVDAFNTYKGTISTPFSYHGCADGEEAHAEGIHDGLEGPRKIASDNLSAALDPFNPTIPCDCPEPEPEPDPAPAPDAESVAEQAIG